MKEKIEQIRAKLQDRKIKAIIMCTLAVLIVLPSCGCMGGDEDGTEESGWFSTSFVVRRTIEAEFSEEYNAGTNTVYRKGEYKVTLEPLGGENPETPGVLDFTSDNRPILQLVKLDQIVKQNVIGTDGQLCNKFGFARGSAAAGTTNIEHPDGLISSDSIMFDSTKEGEVKRGERSVLESVDGSRAYGRMEAGWDKFKSSNYYILVPLQFNVHCRGQLTGEEYLSRSIQIPVPCHVPFDPENALEDTVENKTFKFTLFTPFKVFGKYLISVSAQGSEITGNIIQGDAIDFGALVGNAFKELGLWAFIFPVLLIGYVIMEAIAKLVGFFNLIRTGVAYDTSRNGENFTDAKVLERLVWVYPGSVEEGGTGGNATLSVATGPDYKELYKPEGAIA